jgi:hypothetical protein
MAVRLVARITSYPIFATLLKSHPLHKSSGWLFLANKSKY